MKLTLSSPCSRSNPPLSRQGAALAYLDSFQSHDLVIWTDGSVSFPFDKGGSNFLANCSLCGAEATLSFLAGSVRSKFFRRSLRHLQAFRCSRQRQQVYRFSSLLLLSDSCSVLHLSLYFKLFGRSGKNFLLSPPLLLGYNGYQNTHVFQRTTRLIS